MKASGWFKKPPSSSISTASTELTHHTRVHTWVEEKVIIRAQKWGEEVVEIYLDPVFMFKDFLVKDNKESTKTDESCTTDITDNQQ